MRCLPECGLLLRPRPFEANVKKEISPSKSEGEDRERERERESERDLSFSPSKVATRTRDGTGAGGRTRTTAKHWAFCARIRTRSRRPTSFSGRVKEKERTQTEREGRRERGNFASVGQSESRPENQPAATHPQLQVQERHCGSATTNWIESLIVLVSPPFLPPTLFPAPSSVLLRSLFKHS